MTKTIRSGALLVLPLALAAGIAPAQEAQENSFGWGLIAGAFHSDNVARTTDGPQSETTAILGGHLRMSSRRNRLDSQIDSNLEYHKYFDDTFDDDLVGGVDANVTYWFTPERFSWTFIDNFGQTAIEQRAVETPANRQNTNYFTTGPDVRFSIGGRTDLALSGRWSTSSYETSDADDERLQATLRVIRHLGTRSSLSLNGTYEDIQFDDETFEDGYTRNSVSLGFDARGSRTRLSLQAGYTALRNFNQTSDGPLFSLSIARELGSRSSLTLSAGTGFSDSAEAFRRDRRLGGVVLENDLNVVSQDPFQSDFITIVWALNGSRTTLAVSGDWRSDDHVNFEELNRDSIGGRVTVSRSISSILDGVIEGSWRDEEFGLANDSTSEWSAGAGLTWSLARNLGFNVRYQRFDGSGDSTGFGSRDYTENRYSLAITYTPRR